MGNAQKIKLVERQYDKGERRFKHVGSRDEPEFCVVDKGPRRVIGKCPATIPTQERDRLLNKAVPLSNGDRDLTSPKKIYAVYQGAVYEAQTSDHGRTYHAYPFRGKLSSAIIALLAKMADDEGCRSEFNTWVDKYITRHGQ
jgi:hypothetical protein